jgi:GAF domain-containing protein
MSLTTGGSGRLFVVGQPGRPPFSGTDQELVAEFAKFAALSVENALHSQQSRQQVRWLRGLTLITQALLRADVDERAVWQEIADRVHQLARARAVTISTVSEDDPDVLEVQVAAAEDGDPAPGRLSEREHALATRSMTTRSWQTGTTDETPSPTATGSAAGAALAVPLLDGRGVRGALVVSRRPRQGPFDRMEVAMVHDFANQAMLAVELAETRAAERSLSARTTEDEVAGTFQDRTIQRLFAASLAAEAALAQRPEPWLTRLYAELTAVIEDARSSLGTQYGRTS